MHFCWKDRGTGEVVDDLIIFPDDVMFKHIPPAKISADRCDRIYVLKFKASSRKFFFWMQVGKMCVKSMCARACVSGYGLCACHIYFYVPWPHETKRQEPKLGH